MQNQNLSRSIRSSKVVGLMFLIPGLIWGTASLLTGTFAGAAAVLFGAFLLLTSGTTEG